MASASSFLSGYSSTFMIHLLIGDDGNRKKKHFDPDNLFDPDHFDPDHFDPDHFDPDHFDPDHFDPDLPKILS